MNNTIINLDAFIVLKLNWQNLEKICDRAKTSLFISGKSLESWKLIFQQHIRFFDSMSSTLLHKLKIAKDTK